MDEHKDDGHAAWCLNPNDRRGICSCSAPVAWLGGEGCLQRERRERCLPALPCFARTRLLD